MDQNKKIQSKLFIRGKIHTLTGLHIGGNSVGLKIGGADSVVIKNVLDKAPYIPGSSLRGKMRSLLERSRGLETKNTENPDGGYSDNGFAGNNPETFLGQLFGTSANTKNVGTKNEPTRLIVRDAFLTEDSAKQLQDASNTDMFMTELKTEVSINRISSTANPREFERVPAGAVFEMELILTLFITDDPKKFLDLVFESLCLIQGDSLGGHGSRGYGKVCFKEIKIAEKTIESYKITMENQ